MPVSCGSAMRETMETVNDPIYFSYSILSAIIIRHSFIYRWCINVSGKFDLKDWKFLKTGIY